MEPVFVGIDFGTFNTAIACSNGVREVVQTVVGWPKDHVARNVIGCDVLVGNQIHEHKLALDIVRPFEKGALKYVAPASSFSSEQDRPRQAARLLLEHAIKLIHPPADAPLWGIIGTPSRASLACRQFVLEVASEVLDVAVLVPEPFAVGYGSKQCENALVVDIGAGTIDICPMFGSLPSDEDQVTVPFGGDFIDEDFCHRMAKLHPTARLSNTMARRFKERYGFIADDQKRVQVKLPVKGQPPQEFDITDALRPACEAILPKIVEGIHELIWQLDPEVHQAIISNIVLSGGGSQLSGLDKALEEALGDYGRVTVTRVYDTVFAGAMGALSLAMSFPAEHWQELETMDNELARAA